MLMESLDPRIAMAVDVSMVRDIQVGAGSSSPSGFAEVAGSVYFAADNGTQGRELWKSDGTSAGTSLVKDLVPNGPSSNPSQFTNVGGTLFFVAVGTDGNQRLWKSDGSVAGTVQVRSSGGVSTVLGVYSQLTNVNGTLFYAFEDSSDGFQLWKSNGSSEGTSLLGDFGINNGSPQHLSNLTAVGNTLYFSANTYANGTELWKSDGTVSGTVLVSNIRPGTASSTPSNLTNVNGTLFFTANDGTNGVELWKSDGTASGTSMVSNIASGSSSSSPSNLVNVGGVLYFAADDGTNGTELWKSSGLSSNTSIVSNIAAGGTSSSPRNLANVNGTVYFSADDGSAGEELWKSDGTPSGTQLVKNIRASGSGSPTSLSNVNGTLHFVANDGINGSELWKSNGTTDGTVRVATVSVGALGTSPEGLMTVGKDLFFSAVTATAGRELWLLKGNVAPTDINLSSSSIAENSPVGSLVASLSTVDANPFDTFTYSLVAGPGGTDNSLFSISGATLLASASFDYETKSSYSIRMRSADQDGLFVEKTFTISVTNVNEAPTNISLDAASIAENAPVSTTVGSFTTTDVDAGDSFSYALVAGSGSADNGAFNIVGSELRANASFDFETKASYFIRVKSTDFGGLSSEKTFTITVTDVNEAPTDLSLSVSSIQENAGANATVGTLTTTDVDAGNTFTYELVAGLGSEDNEAFSIIGNALKAKSSFDFESKPSYSIRVRTTDQGGLFTDKAFLITVTDVNESPTDIVLSSSSINENAPANSTVGFLSTSDVDAGESFTYELVGGTGSADNASFSIVGNELRANNPFDFELKSSYSIRVRTTDSGSLKFEKQLNISVVDVDESIYVNGTSANNLVVASYTGNGSQHSWLVTLDGVTVHSGIIYNGGSLVVDGGGGTGDSLRIVGTASADTLILNGSQFSVNNGPGRFSNLELFVFDGGLGTDNLTLSGGNNSWNVTGMNTGSVNGNLSFQSMESLNGGTGDDQFVFGLNGSVTGQVKGGAGSDTLNFAAKTRSHIINLESKTATSTGGIDGFESFIGGTALDTLIGSNIPNVWQISSSNAGLLNAAAFASFENLTGGSDTDDFTVSSSAVMAGRLAGGTGTDTLNLSAKTSSLSFSLGSAVIVRDGASNVLINGFSAFEQVIGNGVSGSRLIGPATTASWTINSLGILISGATYRNVTTIQANTTSKLDTLTGPGVESRWNVTGEGVGTLEVVGGPTYDFSGIDNLTGGLANDTFVLGAAGKLSGRISGGLGSDTLDLRAKSGSLKFDLSATPSPLISNPSGAIAAYTTLETILGNGVSGAEIIGPNAAVTTAWSINTLGDISVNRTSYTGVRTIKAGTGVDTLTGPTATSTWGLTGDGVGTLSSGANTLSFSGMNNLTGGSQNDTFVVGALGKVSGTLSGGTGTDTLNLAAKSSALTFDLRTTPAATLSDPSGRVAAYTGFEAVDGNNTPDSKIFGPTASDPLVATTWIVDAAGKISVSRVLYSGVSRMEANSGLDALTGPALNSNWVVSGTNAGTLSPAGGRTYTFTGFENLNGGALNDQFTFNSLGRITGNIKGGTGADSLDLSAKSGSVNFKLKVLPDLANVDDEDLLDAEGIIGGIGSLETITGNGANSKVYGTNTNVSWLINAFGQILVSRTTFNNVREILAGSAIDTLTGPSFLSSDVAAWTVNAANGGSLAMPGLTVGFSGIENLTGGTSSDAFDILLGGSLTGNLNGGSGTAINSLSYANWTSGVQVDLSTSTTPSNASRISGFTTNIQMVTGGSGNDRLVGLATRSSILIGMAGDDELIGGSQRDLLFGGTGKDRIKAGAGDDLLISGWTSYDSNRTAILQIHSEWVSLKTFAERTANVFGNDGGENHGFYLNNHSGDGVADTVFADSDTDELIGEAGRDWFFAELGEIVGFDSSSNGDYRS